MAEPAHSRRLFFFAAALVLVGAGFLRCAQIERRPFHADEAVQAYQTWQLLRGDGYRYDPADKHGPFLYFAAAAVAKISGWSPEDLNEARLRSVTMLAGLGSIALVLGSSVWLGRGAALVAAALLAVAPLAVIYDTYFVQEAWFCFFTWALFFAALRWGAKPTLTMAVLAGVLVGLMQATKETSVLHFAALGVVLVVVRPLKQFGGPWRQYLAAACAAGLVYVLFYSAGFRQWAGVADGLRTYFVYAARATTSAHTQPWHYYFSMLAPQVRAGAPWGEPLLLIIALVGAFFSFTARASLAQRSLATYTLTLLIIYSVIPYKTPWLLLTPYVGLALLAGGGAVELARYLPTSLTRLAPAGVCLALLLEGGWRDRAALGRYANDERNPYLYQPTSSDLPRLVAALNALPAGNKIAVISPDHAWPLPWYLRHRSSIGYFATPPAQLSAYDIALFDSRLAVSVPSFAAAFGLRPNVILWFAPR